MSQKNSLKNINSIVDIVVDKFNIYSDKVAIRHHDIDYTYSDLHKAANCVATYLVSNGLKVNDRVSLIMANSFEYISIYYGILLSGGVVVPLNTAAKYNDLLSWIKHSDSKWVFSDAKNKEVNHLIPKLYKEVEFIILGDFNRISHDEKNIINYKNIQKDDYTKIKISGNDLASIIYTSGTTGQPKGVTITHINLLTNMLSILECLPIEDTDCCLNVLPFYYSYGNSILHTHMMSGATILLENSLLYPHTILKKIEDEKISSFSGVPSTFALLLNRTTFADYNLSSLRYITQAGGAMLPKHINELKECLPHVELIIMYGQTEATARLAYLPYSKLGVKISSAGKAISGVVLEIRDNLGNKLGSGEIGEIYAYGTNIMKGYWKDEILTSSTIIDDWLKTGDLATMDEEGYIYIVGRKTEMIKSGAHRISPLDIEESILHCEGVAEVAIIGLDDEILGQIIKAFIVQKPGSNIGIRDVQRHCKEHLAIYKIPKIIEFIDKLPTTASGKLKRFELRDIH